MGPVTTYLTLNRRGNVAICHICFKKIQWLIVSHANENSRWKKKYRTLEYNCSTLALCCATKSLNPVLFRRGSENVFSKTTQNCWITLLTKWQFFKTAKQLFPSACFKMIFFPEGLNYLACFKLSKIIPLSHILSSLFFLF